MKLIVFFSLFLSIQSLSSQIKNLPLNAETGKCYAKSTIDDFDYTKTFKGDIWKEVICDSLSQKQENRLICLNDAKNFKKYIKLKKYKEKLISLGYDKIEINPFIDRIFISSHNKYLRKKYRKERREKRKN